MAFVPHWSSSSQRNVHTHTHVNSNSDLPTTSTSSSTSSGVTTDADITAADSTAATTTVAAAAMGVNGVAVSVDAAADAAAHIATDSCVQSDSGSSSSNSSDAKQVQNSVTVDASYFNEQERDQMAQLPSKEYLISYHCTVYSSILEQCEDSVRHQYEQILLCATYAIALISCRVWSTDVQAVVVAGARRSLCYPYLRSWALTHKCVCDVAAILKAGRRVVLKCLLSLHATIGGSEYHYLLNKRQYTDDSLSKYALQYSAAVKALTKADVNFGLVELEASLTDHAADAESDDDSDDSSDSDSDNDSSSDFDAANSSSNAGTSSTTAVDDAQQATDVAATAAVPSNATVDTLNVAGVQPEQQSSSSLDTVTQSLDTLHVDSNIVNSSAPSSSQGAKTQTTQLLDDASVSSGLLSQLGRLSTTDVASSTQTAQHKAKPLIQEL
eukprot:14430-Heterococcus_DN1.PRE.2